MNALAPDPPGGGGERAMLRFHLRHPLPLALLLASCPFALAFLIALACHTDNQNINYEWVHIGERGEFLILTHDKVAWLSPPPQSLPVP